ncbi:MAG: hypothetical protein NPIRA04_05920 [Nitrospirales bacterium]|nr:MAG: hypothetical protein NPIRA04_05920 [Nitrospirales bacterium]
MLFSSTENRVSTSRRLVLAGIVFFIYSLSASATIQLYIIPNIFPQFDLGDGLIILDSSGFNQLAKAKALEIKEQGWKAWELRPQNISPVGIASIFYALWSPKPFSLLPLNSFVHAMSGCIVLWLLSHLFSNRSAIIGSALFIVNPAAMEWVAHIHRDGIFILGNLLVLVCVVQLYRGLELFNVMTMTWGLLGGVLGTCLVWVARPYWVPVLLVFVMFGIVFVSTVFFFTRDVTLAKSGQFLCFIIFSMSCVVFQVWFIKHYGFQFTKFPQEESSIKLKKTLDELNRDSENDLNVAIPSANGIMALSWERTSWLPYEVEAKFYQMARARQGFLWAGGNTVIDTDVTLDSVGDFFIYFPRALQIGLLSPFPELWQGVGSTPSMTLARKVTGIATLVFYVCLISVLMGIILYRRVPILWLILMFSLMGVLVWTYICPNIGTLLRLRAGFYMLLITFGAANMVEMVSVWLSKRQRHEITHYS